MDMNTALKRTENGWELACRIVEHNENGIPTEVYVKVFSSDTPAGAYQQANAWYMEKTANELG